MCTLPPSLHAVRPCVSDALRMRSGMSSARARHASNRVEALGARRFKTCRHGSLVPLSVTGDGDDVVGVVQAFLID